MIKLQLFVHISNGTNNKKKERIHAFLLTHVVLKQCSIIHAAAVFCRKFSQCFVELALLSSDQHKRTRSFTWYTVPSTCSRRVIQIPKFQRIVYDFKKIPLIASLLLTADDIAVVNSNYDQDNNKNTSDAPYQDNTVWNICQ